MQTSTSRVLPLFTTILHLWRTCEICESQPSKQPFPHSSHPPLVANSFLFKAIPLRLCIVWGIASTVNKQFKNSLPCPRGGISFLWSIAMVHLCCRKRIKKDFGFYIWCIYDSWTKPFGRIRSFSFFIVRTHVDHPESVEKRIQLVHTFMFLHGFIASKAKKIGGFCCSVASKRFIWIQALRDWLCAGSGRVSILENKPISTEGNHGFNENNGGWIEWVDYVNHVNIIYIILVWVNCDRKSCKVADLWRLADRGWVTSNLLITRSQRRLTTRLTWTVAGFSSLDDLCLPVCFFPKEEVSGGEILRLVELTQNTNHQIHCRAWSVYL